MSRHKSEYVQISLKEGQGQQTIMILKRQCFGVCLCVLSSQKIHMSRPEIELNIFGKCKFGYVHQSESMSRSANNTGTP